MLRASSFDHSSDAHGAPRAAPAALPNYQGLRYIDARLPARSERWLKPSAALRVQPGDYVDSAHTEQVDAYLTNRPWVWPSERLLFFCDLHADAPAFLASLVASGGIDKRGPHDDDFTLNAEGRDATFLIAGDCFDKGPSNLRLLRTLSTLIARGARVVILAGNHDVRALLGMRCAGSKDPQLAHLFVRMGQKCVPLLKELVDTYVSKSERRTSRSREQALQRELFPNESWYERFASVTGQFVSPAKVAHELRRIREKTRDFEEHCARHDLSLAQVRAAIDAFHAHFLAPTGDFSWYFEQMQLAHRCGSLLFIHGGVDDTVAQLLLEGGIDALNARYDRLMKREAYFELYHGPIGNTFRTKYRDTDYALTEQGLSALHGAGIYAIAHGHRNIAYGQRAIFRSGMLNFECDCSVDQNTRALLDLHGAGAACTRFLPDGRIVGVSADYPAAKVFDPAQHGALLTLV